MATTSTNQFNFEAYNKVMKNANSGLKLFLAEQLLSDVHAVMTRYRNPLSKDLGDIVDEVIQLRADMKKALAERERSANKEIDEATQNSPASTSADGGRVTEGPALGAGNQ